MCSRIDFLLLAHIASDEPSDKALCADGTILCVNSGQTERSMKAMIATALAPLATLLGAVAGIFAGSELLLVVWRTHSEFVSTLLRQYSTISPLLVIIAIIALGVVAGLAARIVILATGVVLVRGQSAMSWVRPSECASLSSWAEYRWRFAGQAGERCFGFEFALQGELQ